MLVEGSPEITGLLAAWCAGDEAALADLISIVYPELRRIARKHLSRQTPGHTLESAAVVNEAYLKLVRARGIECQNRVQFFALCAQIIRRILIDYARRRNAKQHGSVVRVDLDEQAVGNPSRGPELLAMNDALMTLSEIDPRKASVVELRYFGGLSVEETAEVLRISCETVKRDWKLAKAWLLHELGSQEIRTNSA
jgi:RNA polymerase sigma factor (TIGR02999 family)